MKYNILINQKLCVEQNISLNAAALLDLFSELSTWANAESFKDGIYYQIAYNKIITDLPLVFKKSDAVYRSIKELKDKGLIDQCKKGKNLMNFIRLSNKGKSLFRVGFKSEPSLASGLNPTSIGNKPEAQKGSKTQSGIRKLNQGSGLNPTYYNNTINNNIYIDFKAYQFLQKEAKEDVDVWEMQNKKSIENYKAFIEYFEIKVEEEEIEFTASKLLGRLKRLKFNWKGDNRYSSFNDHPIKKAIRLN